MSNFNSFITIGNLGKDPIFTPAADGKNARASFSIAVRNRSAKGEPGSDTPPKWINVTAWGKTAEFVNQYLKKGDRVLVSGTMGWGSYTSKESQQIVETTEINASAVENLSNRKAEGTASAGTPATVASSEDIPF